MAQKRIEQWEIDRYWEIFSSLANGGTHLVGASAATVLKNSQLRDDQLERIWDLADVDNDGKLDFEEFCVAMRLIFDLVNGEYADVPQQLPDWLVPESKAHLVQATRALTGRQPQFEQVDDDDDDAGALRNDFDWYMGPGDKSKYEEIYTANRSANGEVAFNSLTDLYESLDVPDTDIRSAWNLVNPQARGAIGKDACLAFLHILNGRHEGYRVPRSVPPSLRATFEKGNIEYNIDRVGEQRTNKDRWAVQSGDDTSTGRKAKFGDAYLTRLGVGDRAGAAYNKKTDFGGKTTEDWEEVRLKKQLREIEDKMKRVEEAANRGRSKGNRREDTSKPALVKRELEQLLDYKRRELRDLEEGIGSVKEGASLKSIREDIDTVRDQIESLERHWKERERVLNDLKEEIEAAKVGA
ncbi:EF-hand [Pseudovirgaria hyperparasitica]|uniref:Endocytosis protein 3 n=1 Tax=Pseudovirgaria hyperparasitica TaxID=470096 RepID=A0A6A6WJ42_9PEZI|nr:EF-hand [Pseudovirgaria hyperparasitica]KAF2762156.1 EF-hand [Pseudovirgaria hyperparasitica]